MKFQQLAQTHSFIVHNTNENLKPLRIFKAIFRNHKALNSAKAGETTPKAVS